MKKELSKAIIGLLLAFLFVCSPIVGQSATGDLEWGVSKGDVFIWELKTLDIGANYNAAYPDVFELFGEVVLVGDKIECEIIADLPETVDDLDQTQSESVFQVKVSNKDIDLGSLNGTLIHKDPDEDYDLEPFWILPLEMDTGTTVWDLRDWVDDYANEWESMMNNEGFVGGVDVSTASGKVILEVDIPEIGTLGSWNAKVTYEEKNGVMLLYHFNFESILEFKLERESNEDDGLFGAEWPIAPVIFALVIAAIPFYKSRKKQ